MAQSTSLNTITICYQYGKQKISITETDNQISIKNKSSGEEIYAVERISSQNIKIIDN